MAGGIFERYNWPEGRSDYVEVCDGCHTAIWSTRWNEETSDGFDAFLAENGWRDYIDQLDSRILNLCPACAAARPAAWPTPGSVPRMPTHTPTRRLTRNCPPANGWSRTCC